MMLLDLLLRIQQIETNHGREVFAEGLYKTNRKFAQLCDLAYRRSIITRYTEDKELPVYMQDNVPYGYNYSQLEIVYNKLKVAGFKEHGNNRALPDNIADQKMIQVLESLSDVECDFVKHLLRKNIPWFSRESWKRAKHT